MPCNWQENKDPPISPPWQLDINSRTYDDPIQGTIQHNCDLFAALSAIAWTTTSWFKITRCTGTTNFYKFRFFNPAADIVIDDRLQWDGTQFCWGGRSKTSNEIWPALYEKAYAQYLLNQQDPGTYLRGLCTGPITNPSWPTSIPWPGDPVRALSQLTGKSVPSPLPATSEKTAIQVFNDILGKCVTCTTGNNYDHRRTRNSGTFFAIVAATYPDETLHIYGNTPLRVNHAYTVLGVFKDRDYNYTSPTTYQEGTFDANDNFIVIRDPLAVTINRYANAPTSFICPAGSGGISCDGTAGIIAVPASEFQQAIATYGWAY